MEQPQNKRNLRLQILREGMRSLLPKRQTCISVQTEHLSCKWEQPICERFEQCYELGVKMGEGAHGVVRECTHLQTGKKYVAKILPMDCEQAHFLRANFVEVQRLNHPNIVKYKAMHISKNSTVCHLIMEYVKYPSLLKHSSLPESTLQEVVKQILNALAYMHNQQVCHRDIKPQNILCSLSPDDTHYHHQHNLHNQTQSDITTQEPNEIRVKIIDFGVSKNMKKRGRVESMLTVTGTQFYRAPQMFLGGGYDEKVDTWALGITLYKLVTGTTPFQSQYHSDTIERILNQQPDLSLAQFTPYTPGLRDFIFRLLRKSAKGRPSAVEAMHHVWLTPEIEGHLLRSDIGAKHFDLQLKRTNTITEVKLKSAQDIGEAFKNKDRWLVGLREKAQQNDDEQYNFQLIDSDKQIDP